jgi:hypothetical protein
MGIEMRETILKEFPVERGKILTWKYNMPYEGHDQPIIPLTRGFVKMDGSKTVI